MEKNFARATIIARRSITRIEPRELPRYKPGGVEVGRGPAGWSFASPSRPLALRPRSAVHGSFTRRRRDFRRDSTAVAKCHEGPFPRRPYRRRAAENCRVSRGRDTFLLRGPRDSPLPGGEPGGKVKAPMFIANWAIRMSDQDAPRYTCTCPDDVVVIARRS